MVKKGEFVAYATSLKVEEHNTQMQILIEVCEELQDIKSKFNELITRFNEHEKNDK